MGPPNCECRLGRGRAQLTAKIKPENDPPMFTFQRETWFPFPPLPENASGAKCVRVGKLVKMSLAFIERIKQNKDAKNDTDEDLTPQPVVIDPDNPEVGLVVVEATTKQEFGKWEYKIKGGRQQEMNLTLGIVLCLKPHDLICYRAKNGAIWSKATSFDSTFARVRAWDCSDHMSSGYKALNSSSMDAQTSFSRKVAKLVAFIKGCDKVAGSNKKTDSCGQCPTKGVKKDSCVGCDGVPNSKRKEGKETYLNLNIGRVGMDKPTRVKFGSGWDDFQ